MLEPLFLRTSDVAQLFGVCRTTVRRWVRSGKVKAFKVGREFRIPIPELEKLLAEFDEPVKRALQERLEEAAKRHLKAIQWKD